MSGEAVGAVPAVREGRIGAGRSWSVVKATQPGAAHVTAGLPCQDASLAGRWEGGAWACVIVSDGHGSERYFRSERGSGLAVEVLANAFATLYQSIMASTDDPLARSRPPAWEEWAARRVVAEWRTAVHSDLLCDPPRVPTDGDSDRSLDRFLDRIREREGNAGLKRIFGQFDAFARHADEVRSNGLEPSPLPISSDPAWDADRLGRWQAEAYGATLLGVLIGPDALHWLQIGDGAMMQIVGGKPGYLVPPPDEAFANETPSLCADDAVRSVRAGTVPLHQGTVPSTIVLTTDGVPNSYEEPAGFLEFCVDIASAAVDTKLDPAALEKLEREQLPGWLDGISRIGSGDDMSVALAWAQETTGPVQSLPSPPPLAPPSPAPHPEPTNEQEGPRDVELR